ncbi:hypothetical protein [Rhodococcus erythropolis]|nr:hypothetical protein [Rhodococcus erythropolis]
MDKVMQEEPNPHIPEYDQQRAIARALRDAPEITEDDIEFMNKLFAGTA